MKCKKCSGFTCRLGNASEPPIPGALLMPFTLQYKVRENLIKLNTKITPTKTWNPQIMFQQVLVCYSLSCKCDIRPIYIYQG